MLVVLVNIEVNPDTNEITFTLVFKELSCWIRMRQARSCNSHSMKIDLDPWNHNSRNFQS